MAVKIRLARGGAKKRPFYRIVVAESSASRDGRFIEKIGTYNPMVAADHPDRLALKVDRAQYWLSKGAQPTDRVARFLANANLVTVEKSNNPEKAKPKAKAQERLREQEQKRLAAEEAKKQAAEAAKAAAEAPTPVETPAAEPAAEEQAPAAEPAAE